MNEVDELFALQRELQSELLKQSKINGGLKMLHHLMDFLPQNVIKDSSDRVEEITTKL